MDQASLCLQHRCCAAPRNPRSSSDCGQSSPEDFSDPNFRKNQTPSAIRNPQSVMPRAGLCPAALLPYSHLRLSNSWWLSPSSAFSSPSYCQQSRQPARQHSDSQCKNNLKQLALGAMNHHDAHRFFPTGGWGWFWVGDPDRGFGKEQPGGWVYNILPYIEEGTLHDRGKDGDLKTVSRDQRTAAARCRRFAYYHYQLPLTSFITSFSDDDEFRRYERTIQFNYARCGWSKRLCDEFGPCLQRMAHQRTRTRAHELHRGRLVDRERTEGADLG